MPVQKKKITSKRGTSISAQLFLAKLDDLRVKARSRFGEKGAEIPATDDIIKELALLVRVVKAETMYKDVEDAPAPVTETEKFIKRNSQQRRDSENEALLAGLEPEGKYNPQAGPDAAPLGRTPRIRRAPLVLPATADTVADRELLETFGD